MISRISILLSLFVVCFKSYTQDKILMFVSHEETYYSEYIVMREALTHAGYQVEVRSASAMDASTYMIPANTTIDATANTLSGSSYAQFQNQYQNYFGNTWNASLNATPATIPVVGSILDVSTLDMYVAMVIVGGLGAQAYNVDGIYNSQGTGQRFIAATTVQNVAEKLNSLAIEAIISGKPVLGQCHGAGIPAHWRYPVPNMTPPANLGISVLSGSQATGFPEPNTSNTLSSLGITYLPNSPVVLSIPHPSIPDNNVGSHKIITTRDWYPQTVAHAALTLVNIIQTFPPSPDTNVDVLILHGGAVNPNNCHFSNRNNDIPCNYGNGNNDLPADFSHLQSLLQSNSNNDDFTFNITEVNLTATTLPFVNTDECSIITYFNQFDVIIFYKHWSTGVTSALQNAIVSFADHGGGVVALHHGLYNDIDPPTGFNKNILVNQLFNAQSAQSGWGASRINYNFINTNLGHFITTNGLNYVNNLPAPGSWANTIPLAVNTGFSYYFSNTIFDEIYTNMAFVGNPTIGRNTNQIVPLFGIGQLSGLQNFTSGFAKSVDINNDNLVGKIVYLLAGETRANYAITHSIGQIIRNAVYWAGYGNEVQFPTVRWNTASGNWNQTSNWMPQRLPRSCDNVLIPAAPNTPYSVTIPNNSSYEIKSLTLEQNATLIIPPSSTLISND